MSDLAEKVAEETISAGGTGFSDYRKDFRYLAEIDKTHMELPYTLATYFNVSDPDLAIGETKSWRLQAYGEGAASETRDRFFVSGRFHFWNYIGILGMTEIFHKQGEAIIVDVYYILNAVTYPLLTRIFTWLTHRSFTWAAGQPNAVIHFELPQLVKIPAGAQFWVKITNRTDTFLAGAYPAFQFMEIT